MSKLTMKQMDDMRFGAMSADDFKAAKDKWDSTEKVKFTATNTQWVDSRSTVCIDFNGVLDTYSGFNGNMYPPREGAYEFLKTLKQYGFKVVVLTSCDAMDVHKWLAHYNFLPWVDSVTNTKVPAIVYLDDRGITFNGNFDDALKAIINFKCFWEDAEHKETPDRQEGFV